MFAALGDSEGVTIGLDARAAVENRLAQLEGGSTFKASGAGKGKSTQYQYDKNATGYNPVFLFCLSHLIDMLCTLRILVPNPRTTRVRI